MDQAEFDSKLPSLDFRPLAKEERVVLVDATASGAEEEVYDCWGGGPESGWLLLLARYGASQPRVVDEVRPFLAGGARCVVRKRA